MDRVTRVLGLRTLARRVDPTNTLRLREDFAKKASGRLQQVQRSITREVTKPGAWDPGGRFWAKTHRGRVAAFRRWVGTEIDTALALDDGLPWAREFMERGYLRGLKDANIRVKATGLKVDLQTPQALLRDPLHREALEELLEVALQEAKDIARATESAVWRDMDKQLRRTTRREAAASARNRVAKVGQHRMRKLAHVNTIKTHAESGLTRYGQLGIQQVQGLAEFLTAQDDRVCPRCEALEGEVFPIDEARGVIPVHVGCRCTWVPKLSAEQLTRVEEGARGRLAA